VLSQDSKILLQHEIMVEGFHHMMFILSKQLQVQTFGSGSGPADPIGCYCLENGIVTGYNSLLQQQG
jgi:hypothetical protein